MDESAVNAFRSSNLSNIRNEYNFILFFRHLFFQHAQPAELYPRGTLSHAHHNPKICYGRGL